MAQQSIPCSPKCKIVGQILLDHPLGYALTATVDVPIVYLQQFYRTVSKVPGPEDTIKFMLNTQEFIYTVYMFRDILHLPVETPENPFVAPVNIETIEAFMNRVGYQGVGDKKFPYIPQRIEEDYYSIKDDIPLVSVYTTRNVLVRGMLIPDAFLTEEIRATDDFKEYETVFMNVDVPMNQSQPGKKRKQSAGESSLPRQSHKITIKRKKPSTTLIPPPSNDRERDGIIEATLLSLTLHKTALAVEAQENIAKVQEKLAEEEIEKMVEGDEDEKSYASEFADSVLNDDVDDSGTRLEPESHKENPKKEEKKDDVEIEKEKEDEEIKKEKNNDNVEETDKVVKEKDIVDDVTGSMEIRKEQKQTLIPSPTRSPRNVLSSDKTVSEELTATVSPTTATTSIVSSTTKARNNLVLSCQRLYQEIREVLDHCNKVVPDTTFAKTKEMIIQEMPHLVNLAVNKDHEYSMTKTSSINNVGAEAVSFLVDVYRMPESYSMVIFNVFHEWEIGVADSGPATDLVTCHMGSSGHPRACDQTCQHCGAYMSTLWSPFLCSRSFLHRPSYLLRSDVPEDYIGANRMEEEELEAGISRRWWRKMTGKDKDYKYMATSDLLNELNKEGFKLDGDLELRLSMTILQQLDDATGDVSSLAIKWVVMFAY
ncbi:retrovirus-related pol polyprotein from transposon TNT 1-94 [Tanacetum coccineum]